MKGRSGSESGLPGLLMYLSAWSLGLDGNDWVTHGGGGVTDGPGSRAMKRPGL